MKDVFGNELEIGDTVAFMETGYTYALKIGTIVKFTPQKLIIDWCKNKKYNPNEKTYKFPKQVAKNNIGEQNEN